MFIFEKTVACHETDLMGITHHSNYVKWMEEARVAFLAHIGLPFDSVLRKGIESPVTSVSVDYKSTSTFANTISIEVSVSSYSGVRLEFEYKMTKALTGELVASATSGHCFIKNGKVVSLKKCEPEIHSVLESTLTKRN